MTTKKRAGPIVLVTGSTGYIGSKLTKRLVESKVRVRCLVRRPGDLPGIIGPGIEVVQGDVLDPVSLETALKHVKVAYYLIHSMQHHDDYVKIDRQAAMNFAAAAEKAGVERIIYLGGLGHYQTASEHLNSRQEVGRILRSSGVPTIEFRASVVIGRGSLAFDMVRNLADKLPVMIIPRWVRTPTQPISIDDLLDYLDLGRDVPLKHSRIYEIGGADQVSYLDLMKQYAEVRGLTRRFIPVPVLTPRLSALWLSLFTPLQARVGRKLAEGLRSPTVVTNTLALDHFPIRPMGMKEAITRALRPKDMPTRKRRRSPARKKPAARRQTGV